MTVLHLKLKLSFIYLACLMIGCAVEADQERPGVCSLDCGSAIIGSSDAIFKIKPMNKVDTIACDPGLGARTPLARPVSLEFLMTEKYGTGENEKFRPVPNISFEPIIVGEMSETGTPTENLSVNGQPTQKYLGIVTSKFDWCSNSCGVMNVEFIPLCLPAGSSNQVSVVLHSGSLFSEGVNIEVVSPTTQE